MSQAVHILRKDLWRLRWWLAGWMMMVGLRVVLVASGWNVATEDTAGYFVFEQVNSIVSIATWLLFGLLVARLVHDEPLVGLDWFWLSRPYDRWALLAAKLAFASVIFVIVPLIGELVVMAALEARADDMLRASPAFLARDVRWTLGLMVFAVLTPTLVGFALALVGTATALSLLMFGVFAVAMLVVEDETPDVTVLADPTAAIVGLAVFVAAALAVIAYQYHRRRPGRAVGLAVVGLAAIISVPALWPRVRATQRIEPAPLAFDAGRVSVDIDRSVPPEIYDELGFRRRSGRDRQVHIAAELSGVPMEYRVQSTFARSRLEFPDGYVIHSGQSGGGLAVALTSGSARPADHPLRSALGNLRILHERPAIESDRRPMTAVLTVSGEELARYGSVPGQLTSTLVVSLRQPRIVATLPLEEGASFHRDGMRVEILRVRQRYEGCTVVLRRWEVSPLGTPAAYRHFDFALRNLERGEAAIGQPHFGRFSAGGGLPFLFLGLGFQGAAQEGFNLQHQPIDFGRRVPGQPEALRVDAAWLERADLAVIETAPAGTVTRTITLDDFRMQPPPSTP